MNRTNPAQSGPQALLQRLAQGDFDAVTAYLYAINSLIDHADQEILREFSHDHQQQLEDLRPCAQALGTDLPRAASLKAILARGSILIGSLMGDEAVLHVMLFSEEHSYSAYLQARGDPALSPALRSVIEKTIAQERQHTGWLRRRLEIEEAPATLSIGKGL